MVGSRQPVVERERSIHRFIGQPVALFEFGIPEERLVEMSQGQPRPCPSILGILLNRFPVQLHRPGDRRLGVLLHEVLATSS